MQGAACVSDEAATADLTEQLARLEGQLTELHAEARRLGVATSLPVDPVDPRPPRQRMPGSARSRPRCGGGRSAAAPARGLFLAAAAAAAAIAELDAVAIAGVMVGAWVLVALIEWAASRADRRQEVPVYAPVPAAPPGADPAWYAPPVEQTFLDAGVRRLGDRRHPPATARRRGRGNGRSSAMPFAELACGEAHP